MDSKLFALSAAKTISLWVLAVLAPLIALFFFLGGLYQVIEMYDPEVRRAIIREDVPLLISVFLIIPAICCVALAVRFERSRLGWWSIGWLCSIFGILFILLAGRNKKVGHSGDSA